MTLFLTVAICAPLMVLGIALVFHASRLARRIVRNAREDSGRQGLFADGKIYNFIDFIRLSQFYVEKTGDRRTVFAAYALTIVGSVLSVASWLAILMKLNLPK